MIELIVLLTVIGTVVTVCVIFFSKDDEPEPGPEPEPKPKEGAKNVR
jgi:hypothetical protein